MASYCSLTPGREYLKCLSAVTSAENGVTSEELDICAANATDYINSRLARLYFVPFHAGRVPITIQAICKKLASADAILMKLGRDKSQSSYAAALKKWAETELDQIRSDELDLVDPATGLPIARRTGNVGILKDTELPGPT